LVLKLKWTVFLWGSIVLIALIVTPAAAIQHSNDLSGDSGDNPVGSNVFRNNGTSSDNRSLSHDNPWHENHPCTDPCILLDSDWSKPLHHAFNFGMCAKL